MINKYDSFLTTAIFASIEAGEKILQVYDGDHGVELKEDKSPLTIADKLAHEKISERLRSTNLPVLSEEGKSIGFDERKNWKLFWLVDPLDGTKEFIKRNGEFTVNIALIENHESVLGVIYAPVPDTLYFGMNGAGSYMLKNASEKIILFETTTAIQHEINSISTVMPVDAENRPFTVVASRSHLSPETESLITALRNEHGELRFISSGSSLKICLVAEGAADIYPRLAPTMEWDTAAGQSIAINAGCIVEQHPSGDDVVYNKENLLNPHFIVSRK